MAAAGGAGAVAGRDEVDRYVELVCVKDRSKLRVRITTHGYYNFANCMFPREIRKENTRYRVLPSAITLITSRGRYYYSIKNRDEIEVVAHNIDLSSLKVYEDASTSDCAVCLDAPKNTILHPCGHYYMCNTCARTVTRCPICRAEIRQLIDKSSMD